MKKLVSFLLVFALLFAFAASSFAAICWCDDCGEFTLKLTCGDFDGNAYYRHWYGFFRLCDVEENYHDTMGKCSNCPLNGKVGIHVCSEYHADCGSGYNGNLCPL